MPFWDVSELVDGMYRFEVTHTYTVAWTCACEPPNSGCDVRRHHDFLNSISGVRNAFQVASVIHRRLADSVFESLTKLGWNICALVWVAPKVPKLLCSP